MRVTTEFLCSFAIAISVVISAALGCGGATAPVASREDVTSAFASNGLTLIESGIPVAGVSEALAHFPDSGGEADLIVGLFPSRSAAQQYANATRNSGQVDIAAVQESKNVVLVVMETAPEYVVEAASRSMSALDS